MDATQPAGSPTDRPAEPPWMARMPEAQRERMRRGEHPADPRRLGSTVAVIGGVVFAWSYGDGVVDPTLLLVLRVLATAAAVYCLWRMYLRPVALGMPPQPHRFAWLIYLGSVVAMLVAIALGRWLLASNGLEHAAPAWIAACVGLHFLPFAWAFRERMLTLLGWAVGLTGLAGVALAIALGAPWGDLGAIVAGLVQLGVVAAWASTARTAA